MAIPPNMSMNDFKEMQRGEWGTSSTERTEYKAEQAAKTESLREFVDSGMIPFRQAFPKDYKLPATGTEGLVCDDIAERQKLGTAKYGTTVCANPLELRAWLQHAYEEALDQAIYLKRAIQELDK